MWFYKGTKVKYFSYQIKNCCSTKFEINPTQITTIITEYTENLLNFVKFVTIVTQ